MPIETRELDRILTTAENIAGLKVAVDACASDVSDIKRTVHELAPKEQVTQLAGRVERLERAVLGVVLAILASIGGGVVALLEVLERLR